MFTFETNNYAYTQIGYYLDSELGYTLVAIDEDGVEDRLMFNNNSSFFIDVYSDDASENIKTWLRENGERETNYSGVFPSKYIVFYIDGVEYRGEADFTWDLWVNSDYNPIDEESGLPLFYCVDDSELVFVRSGGYCIYNLNKRETLERGGRYTIY